MTDSQDQRYIRIAQACLRAINQAADSREDRAGQIRTVYDAIDRAFQAELKVYRSDIDHLSSALERIAGGQLTLDQAQSLAAKAINAPSRTGKAGRTH